jgi:hypothetical protein
MLLPALVFRVDGVLPHSLLRLDHHPLLSSHDCKFLSASSTTAHIQPCTLLYKTIISFLLVLSLRTTNFATLTPLSPLDTGLLLAYAATGQ